MKLLAKLALARLPIRNELWHRLRIFDHGPMSDPEYAFRVFRAHFERARIAPRDGFVALELGPGASLFSAMVAYAFGASASYLVDVGSFAVRDIRAYRAMARFLDWQGRRVPDIRAVTNLEQLLQACRAVYCTRGMGDLRAIPSEAVDFAWSHSVLQYIRRREFVDMMRELRRVLRSDGASSHRVDLRDGLANGLNHLRFSERLWEADWMARAGFYTNRIRYSEMLSLFAAAGFEVEVVGVDCWDRLPTAIGKLAPEFARLGGDELKVSGFDVVLRPC